MDVQVNRNYSFTLIAAHLKSRRALPEADEAELRLEEAKRLREKIDARLTANPDLNLIVLGDFNDTCDSSALRAIIGRGKRKLVEYAPRRAQRRQCPQPESRLGAAQHHLDPLLRERPTPIPASISSS